MGVVHGMVSREIRELGATLKKLRALSQQEAEEEEEEEQEQRRAPTKKHKKSHHK